MSSPAPRIASRGWNDIVLVFLLILGAAIVLLLQGATGRIPGAVAEAVVGLLAIAAWAFAIHFILLDTWGRWFWLALLVLAAVLGATLGNSVALGVGVPLSTLVLMCRRYRTWRHISARRRAVGFGLGIAAIALLFFLLPRFWGLTDGEGPTGRLHGLGTWSLVSLAMFWFFSLFQLAIRMRLHFLRLRPKLAVSAFLIGIIPLVLMIVLGLAILYTGLGGARAARTKGTLESWRAMTAAGTDLSGALFDTTFSWPGAGSAAAGGTVIPAPDWTPRLAELLRGALADETRLHREQADSVAAAWSDTTDWFLAGQRLWLMRWRDLDSDAPRMQAWQLGQRPLRELSGLLKVGLDIMASGTQHSDGELVLSTPTAADLASFPGLEVSYRDVSGEKGYWDDFSFFGTTLVDVVRMKDESLDTKSLIFNLRVGWADLKTEFVEGDSNLNILVVVVLGLLVFTFLVLEVFALFFGIRISEGIVSAVHVMHRGTRRVAAGDLDTVIDIPNEDEFGDLAASFNDMTAAVKQGRAIALANDRLTQELATARAIQIRLLPSTEPVLSGFEVTGASIPSREIGGDYFDFLARGDDKIGIAIGDVSGKGMPAALLMSNLQASLHGQVLHPGDVSAVVQRVNDLLVASTDPHMFATFFYGLLDVPRARFTCTNAGHNPPLLLKQDGRIVELTTGGLLLGMLGQQVYQQDTVQLEPGEVIVLYTDGITEAVGPGADEEDHEAMFGEEALMAVLRASRNLPAAGIKEAIFDAVKNHTAGEAQSDDITLVVIRRQG